MNPFSKRIHRICRKECEIRFWIHRKEHPLSVTLIGSMPQANSSYQLALTKFGRCTVAIYHGLDTKLISGILKGNEFAFAIDQQLTSFPGAAAKLLRSALAANH